MKKEEFTKIIAALDERISKCEEHFGGIGDVIDFEDLSIKHIHAMIDFANSEHEVMTKIAMVDLYHILGMGKLSSSQLAKFNNKMCKYLSYRPFIGETRRQFKNLYDIPKHTSNRSYNLIGLCDLELKIGDELACEPITEISSIEEYTELHKPRSSGPTMCDIVAKSFTTDGVKIETVDGSFEIIESSLQIRVPKERAPEFEFFMCHYLKARFKFVDILEYPRVSHGIIWIGEDDGYFYGKIKTRGCANNLLRK